jgi:hypothetical protein
VSGSGEEKRFLVVAANPAGISWAAALDGVGSSVLVDVVERL